MFLPCALVLPACVCCEGCFRVVFGYDGWEEAFEAAAGSITGIGWMKDESDAGFGL